MAGYNHGSLPRRTPPMLRVLVLMVLAARPSLAADDDPLRVVFLAGTPDSHAPGTHEYESSARLLAHALATSGLAVDADVVPGGWPDDPARVADADVVVLITAGADQREEDHPVLVPDRWPVLERAVDAGAGLVVVHWSTFVPRAVAGDRFLEWVGGHFDYETGPPPRRFASKIRTLDTTARPVGPHPILRGVEAFSGIEEWYYQMRLVAGAPGFTPLLEVDIPGVDGAQTVAWAMERDGGGRGFTTTGGHFLDSYRRPAFRRLLLNAIAWCGGRDVPGGGIDGADADRITARVESDDPSRRQALVDALLVDPRFRVIDGDGGEKTTDLTVVDGDHFVTAFRTATPTLTTRGMTPRTWDARDGGSGHDPRGSFQVTPQRGHPISDELPVWFTEDELAYRLLETASAVPLVWARSKDDARASPLAWARQLETGRVFQTTLGRDAAALRSQGTAALILRGATWTAGRTAMDLDVAVAAAPTNEVPDGFVSPELWTPPYREGDPESEREQDWVDARFERMDTGPTLAISVHTPRGVVPKGIAIRTGEGREAGALFDISLLRMRALWSGRLLDLSPARFGLLRMPALGSTPDFTTGGLRTRPLPADVGRWRGHHLHGERVILDYELRGRRVLDHPWTLLAEGLRIHDRSVEVAPGPRDVELCIDDEPRGAASRIPPPVGVDGVAWSDAETAWAIVVRGAPARVVDRIGGAVVLEVPASNVTTRCRVLAWTGDATRLARFWTVARHAGVPASLDALTGGGPRRFDDLTTTGHVGEAEGPFAVDTLTLPFDNPWGALMFTSGVDFLTDGDAVVCTAHGDVWRVDGVDDDLDRLRWTRFATGLYQPLGLRVIEGVVTVLGRDQITRLHDRNGDGEADFYESFCDLLDVRGDDHAYAMGLERDSAGNLYFQKSGGLSTEHGGATLRVSADGERIDRVGVGFRHANGIGVGPDDVVTNADNQGNWIPATRINRLFKGDYYGGFRPSHRGDGDPDVFDEPLCWIPHRIDNSAGGQVWVEGSRFGLPDGTMLHTSYGRCNVQLVLDEEVDGVPQGGVVPLPHYFESGVMRGRFHPRDGQLYVTGLEGWQTAARRDGCLQRLRYTGGPLRLPVALRVRDDGVRLTFTEPLDPTFGVSRRVHRHAMELPIRRALRLRRLVGGGSRANGTRPGARGRREAARRSANRAPVPRPARSGHAAARLVGSARRGWRARAWRPLPHHPSTGAVLEVTPDPRVRAAGALLLVAILAFALHVRACLTSSGVDGVVLPRNDEMHYVSPTIDALNGERAIHYFINPSLAIHLLRAAVDLLGWIRVATGDVETFADHALDLTLDPGTIHLVGRGLSIALALFGVALMYAVGARAFAPRVGLVAAAALAGNLIHASRSVLAGNEVLMVAAGLLFLLAALRYLERPSTRRHALAGAALGVAVSAKYNAGVLGLALVIVAVAAALRRDASVKATAPRFWVGFPCVALGFFATSPWGLVHLDELVRDFRIQASYLHEGWVDRNVTGGAGLLDYVTTFPEHNNGLPFALLCGVGLVAALWQGARRDPLSLLVGATPIATWIYLGTGVFHHHRFLLPVTPLILLAGAWALDVVVRRFTRRSAVTALAGIAILAPAAIETRRAVHRDFCADDSRRDLVRFAREHVPPDERWLEFAHPVMFRLLGDHQRLRRLDPDATWTAAQQARIDAFRRRTPRGDLLQSLMRDASTLDALLQEIDRRGYRRLLVCLPTEDAYAMTRLPGKVHDEAVRTCPYWTELVEWMESLPRVKTVVSHDQRLLLFVLAPRDGR